MKSYKGELKAIEHHININQARSLLGNASYDLKNSSPFSLYVKQSKSGNQQMNLNNTETTACIEGSSSRTQPNYPNEEHTWRELSFNIHSQIIKVQEFNSYKNRKSNNKNRPLSSKLSSPILKALNRQEKSTSLHNNNNNNNMSRNGIQSKSSILKKYEPLNSMTRVRTEEDRQFKKKGQQQMQNVALFDFLQDHLSDLYSDQALDPYKPNMNLQKRNYAITDESLHTESSIQALEKKMKLKNISDQQKIEEEYQLERKKALEENKLYFKKLYKIQKSALNNYLHGEGVEEKVIKCHKEIVNPLSAYVQQKQRENQQKHEQEMNRSFIRNNKRPIFESQIKKKNEYAEMQTLKNKSKKNELNQAENSVQDIQTNKEQIQQTAQVTFLDNFLKGERIYFQKLGDIQKTSLQNFIQDIHVSQKYYFDQQVKPEKQFMTETDLKIEKNANVMKLIQQKQQSNLISKSKDSISSSIILNKNSKESLHKKISSKMSPDIKPILPNQQILLEESTLHNSKIMRKKLTFLEQDQANQETERLTNKIKPSIDIENKEALTLSQYKKSKLLSNMLDKYSQKQEEFYSTQKEPITQKTKADQSITKMNQSKNLLSQNIQSIYQISKLTEFEQEIFQYVKKNNIKELEACLQINQDIVHLQDNTGKTLLHWAAMRGFDDIVNLLIQYKSNLSILDLGNKTAKDLAQMHHQQKVYSILQKEERYQKQIKIPNSNLNPFNNANLNSSIMINADFSPQLQFTTTPSQVEFITKL